MPIRPKIYLIGDSLTYFGFSTDKGKGPGWASIMQYEFSNKADIVNRGVKGYNTKHAKAVLPSIMGDLRSLAGTVYVFVFLGCNDASPRDQVTPEEYEGNLGKIVEKVKQSKSVCEVVVLGPPAFDPDAIEKGDYAGSGRTLEMTRKYADKAQLVAEKSGAIFVDIFKAMMDKEEGERNEMFIDGLHFSSAGNRFVADLVRSALPGAWSPTDLPRDLPKMSQLEDLGPASLSSLTPDAIKELARKAT